MIILVILQEMATFKKLKDIMSQIQIIYIESKQKISIEKKLENYNKANLYINEAEKLLEDLINNIKNLNTTNVDKSQISKVNHYIELLTSSNPKFDEIYFIVEQLMGIISGVPSTTSIIDNIDQEVTYEEEEINHECV
jgi:hypothetical protein